MKLLLLVLSFILSFSACKNTPKCKYNPPSALFDEGNPTVKSQQFQVKEMSSSETVTFTNDMKLDLLQSGCEKLVQEYRFEIPGDADEHKEGIWVERAVQLFQFLGSVNPNIFEMANAWSNLIELQKENIPLDEDYPITEGFVLNLSKIKGTGFSTLIIVIKEK